VRSLANSARAGLSLAQGIELAAAEGPPPLKAEFARIANEFNRGLPLSEAIERAKQRLQLESFSTFAAVVRTSLDQGGRIAPVLENIAQHLEEQQRLDRLIESETAAGRKEILVLALFPVVFLAGSLFLFPEGTWKLFTTLPGQVFLGAAACLTYLCVAYGKRIINIS